MIRFLKERKLCAVTYPYGIRFINSKFTLKNIFRFVKFFPYLIVFFRTRTETMYSHFIHQFTNRLFARMITIFI